MPPRAPDERELKRHRALERRHGGDDADRLEHGTAEDIHMSGEPDQLVVFAFNHGPRGCGGF